MSHHEGVSCDSCLKRNFHGKRYKCLICLDYDLCSACHDAGTLSGRHTSNHPMQCILTRNDLEFFFAGESIANDQPYSYTCPICGRLGFTDVTLYDHVNVSHSDNSIQVVCPICATLPEGEPNQVTDDFLSHLNLEHRVQSNNASNRELEEPQIVRIRPRNVRMSHTRNRRSQFLNSATTSSASSANVRDSIDPIAQLLSQLSDVRRANATSTGSGSSATTNGAQNLIQFSFDRQANRSSLERIIQRQRRQMAPGHVASSLNSAAAGLPIESNSNQSMPYVFHPPVNEGLDPVTAASPSVNNGGGGVGFNNVAATITSRASGTNSVSGNQAKIASNYLLSTCALTSLSEEELEKLDARRAERSIFVQELILASLSDSIYTDRLLPPASSGVDNEIKTQSDATAIDDPAAAKSGHTDTDSACTDSPNSNSRQVICSAAETTAVKPQSEKQQQKLPTTATAPLQGHDACKTSLDNGYSNGHQNNEPTVVESNRQQKASLLAGGGGGGGGTAPTFMVAPTAARNSKTNKVRSSPTGITPPLAAHLRHSNLTGAGGPTSATLDMVSGGGHHHHHTHHRGAGNVVLSPGGRRKILKQPTEPPPH